MFPRTRENEGSAKQVQLVGIANAQVSYVARHDDLSIFPGSQYRVECQSMAAQLAAKALSPCDLGLI